MNSRSDNPSIATAVSTPPLDVTASTPPSSEAPPNFKSWLAPLLLLVVLQFGAPFIPLPNAAVTLASLVILILLYVAGVVGFSLGIARQQWSMQILGVGLAVCGLSYGATRFMPPNFAFGYVLQSFALLGVGTFFGLIVSRFIKYPNMVGPIGVLVALIDIWGVLLGGIVAQLLTNEATKPIAKGAMGGGPKIGAAVSKFSLALPDIGIGDYLFLAFFLGLLVRFGMNWRASAIWMWVGVCGAFLAIMLLPMVPMLPGLLFLGAGAVLPNLKYFQFTREEKFALLYAGIFVVVLTIGLYLGLTSMLPEDKKPTRQTQRAQTK